jgi:ABC-type Fe3+-hydroxamate transport system substrate-binding protein
MIGVLAGHETLMSLPALSWLAVPDKGDSLSVRRTRARAGPGEEREKAQSMGQFEPGNYMDDLIRIGGGRNLATGAVMTPAGIEQANPDIIIVPLTYWTLDTFEGLRYAREPWMQNLTAVRTGNVYAVGYDVVGRPGPRIGYAAEIMARAIHPEIFY